MCNQAFGDSHSLLADMPAEHFPTPLIMQVKKRWQDEPTTSGEVSISGLSVGEHHFVCAVYGHCQAGMRFTVTVTPNNEEHMDSEQVSTHQLNSLTTKCIVVSLYCIQDIVSHTVPWRIQEYEDLTVFEGERVIFTWQGFHSLHQVSNGFQ